MAVRRSWYAALGWVAPPSLSPPPPGPVPAPGDLYQSWPRGVVGKVIAASGWNVVVMAPAASGMALHYDRGVFLSSWRPLLSQGPIVYRRGERLDPTGVR